MIKEINNRIFNFDPIKSHIKITFEEKHRGAVNDYLNSLIQNSFNINQPSSVNNYTKVFSPEWGNVEINYVKDYES